MKTFELFNKVITGELYSLSGIVLEIENDSNGVCQKVFKSLKRS